MYLIQRNGIYLPQTASEAYPAQVLPGDKVVEIDPYELLGRAFRLFDDTPKYIPQRLLTADNALPDLNTQREKEIL